MFEADFPLGSCYEEILRGIWAIFPLEFLLEDIPRVFEADFPLESGNEEIPRGNMECFHARIFDYRHSARD